MKKAKKPLWRRLLRPAAQLALLAIVAVGASLRNLGLDGLLSLPEIPGLCPIGAIGNLARLVSGQAALDPAKPFVWVLIGILGTTLIWGPVFCSWACPLGSVQEFMGKLGRRLLGKRFNRLVPPKLDRVLSALRYPMLALVVLSALGIAALPLDAINPSLGIFHSLTAAVPVSALILGVLILAASLLVERPWCRWLCPLGGLLGLISRLSLFGPRRRRESCVSCGACDRACPMGVKVSKDGAVSDSRCNRCGRCAEACPAAGTLPAWGPRWRKR